MVGVLAVQMAAHDILEYGISKELQSLIVASVECTNTHHNFTTNGRNTRRCACITYINVETRGGKRTRGTERQVARRKLKGP